MGAKIVWGWLKRNRFTIALILVLLFALWIRLRFLIIESLWPDEALYLWYGQKLASSPSYLFSVELWKHHPPLFALLIALFSIPFGTMIGAKIVVVLVSLAGVVLIYLVGKELHSESLGLMAAILLSVHHHYWFHGLRILADVPLTTIFLLVGYASLRYMRERSWKWLGLVLVGTAAALSIKRVGVMVLPFLFLYFAYVHIFGTGNEKMKVNKRALRITISILGAALLIYAILYIFDVTVFGEEIRSGKITELFNIFDINFLNLFGAFFIPFMLIGALSGFRVRKHAQYFLLFYAIAVIGFRIFFGGISLPRYILPSVPAFILFGCFGLFDIKRWVKRAIDIEIKHLFLFGIVILLAIPFYLIGFKLHLAKSYSYTGFGEAGAWLGEHAGDTYIMAGSRRAIRFFSGKDYIENGGTIANIPKTKTEFESIIKDKEHLLLVTDRWEYTQPKWLYRPGEETRAYLASSGFTQVKTIERYVPPKGSQPGGNLTVVRIFKKEASTKEASTTAKSVTE